jgi:hypothetical protein
MLGIKDLGLPNPSLLPFSTNISLVTLAQNNLVFVLGSKPFSTEHMWREKLANTNTVIRLLALPQMLD